MTGPDRTAPGPAAGYHFQIQRALLDLLDAGGDNPAVSLESLDDVVLTDNTATTLEQMKHSINPGALTDASRPWWDALAVWMDLAAAVAGPAAFLDLQLRLVTTATAPSGSAAALLRRDELRDPDEARTLLLAAASKSKNTETERARGRFRGDGPDGLTDGARRALIDRVAVLDAQPGVGEFVAQLRARLRPALPLRGADRFVQTVMGMWEGFAVDLLLRCRSSVSRVELEAEIARIRDGFTDHTLPDPDPADALDEVILAAYHDAPFVHQLNLVRMRSRRVRRAIESYHRAFAQRARWLDEGIVAPGDLALWEERLVYVWGDARDRMLDEVDSETDDEVLARAGLRLHDEVQDSDRVPFRDSHDVWLQHGTHHGLAETGVVGWHRDFRERLRDVLGDPDDAPGVTFRALNPDVGADADES